MQPQTASIIVLTLFALFAFSDIKSRIIPNVIILPAMVFALYLTHNFLGMAVMYCVGAHLYEKGIWRGGDVKLCMLCGALFGTVAAFTIFVIVWTLLHIYFWITKKHAAPCAPFFLLSIVPFVM